MNLAEGCFTISFTALTLDIKPGMEKGTQMNLLIFLTEVG